MGCYYDKICGVKRKYGFENATTEDHLDFCINNGFVKPVNSRGKYVIV